MEDDGSIDIRVSGPKMGNIVYQLSRLSSKMWQDKNIKNIPSNNNVMWDY